MALDMELVQRLEQFDPWRCSVIRGDDDSEYGVNCFLKITSVTEASYSARHKRYYLKRGEIVILDRELPGQTATCA